MVNSPFWNIINREEAGIETIWDDIKAAFGKVEELPSYITVGQKPIIPYNISVTTTPKIILNGTQSVQYKKIYYLSIQVQDFQTCNSVYLTFNNQPTAANITLTPYNGIYTFNSPENGSIDLTGLFVYCDTGTAIVSISGVAY